MSSERCTRRKCDTGQSKQPKRRHRRQPSSTMSTMKTTAINGFTSALVLLAMVSSCLSAELNTDFVSMDVDMMASASSLVADGVVTGAINGHFVVSRAPDDGRLRSFVDDDMSFARSAEKRELRAFFGNVSAADFEGLVSETSRKILEQKGEAFLTAGFSDEVRNATLWGLVTEEVSRQLLSRSNVRDVDSSAVQESLARLTLGQSCPLLGGRHVVCDQTDYRSFDGTCNNLEHPMWGATNTPFHRILPARFGDGLASEPKAKSGEKLPSPWQIANNVHAVQPATVNRYVSAITPFWGQLVVNDILKTDRFRATPNDESCVSEEASPKTASSPSSESWPIRGNSNGVFCIDYRRSLTSPKHQCRLGAREQVNLASSFLDGSLIYGNSESDAGFLRSFSGGLMKLDAEGLPIRGPADSCQEIGGCFLVGDARANENAGQAALATLLLREHNRIAETLQTFNPHWDDEKTFQETRRIVIAEIQHVTFNEFLQTVLDEVHYFKNDLGINHSGYSIGYSTTLNPGVGNAVGSSVIGFLSTMFPLNISIVNHTTDALLSIPADSGLYNPGLLKTADDVDSVVAGLVVSQASNVGPTFGSHEASKYMAAYSIQQGRDHGLQGYTSYRKWCGFPAVTKFGDLAPILGDKAVTTLQSTFETVDDIDLLTGGLLEKPTEGSLVGPTFSCIMAQQFRRLREADRFWYESDIPPAKFSKGQLNEIRKVSLAGLICANTRISQVQPQVFLSTDPFLNAPVLCASLESMSLDSWRELEPPEIVVPDNLLDESILEAGKDVMVRYHREVELVEKNLIAQPGSASAKAYGFHVPSEAACKQGNYSLMLELATRKLAHLLEEESTVEARRVKRQIVPQGNFLPSAAPQFNQIFVGDRVPRPPRTCPDAEDNRPCDPKSPFRTYSGWCNNLEKPQYGKDLTPFNRLLAPKYEDGISRPRSLSVTGRPLPSPRLISSFIHADISRPHSRYTLIVMQFGQFLDHDITLTPVHSGFNGAALECKECDSAIRVHPECFPIPMPPNDPYYPHVNEQTGRPFCIPLVRSLPGQTKLGPREQLNQNTAFLDGSQVYGQNICDARILRNFVGGQLNATSHPQRGKQLLPQTTKFRECEAPSKVCFIGGDNRPSEQPGLAAIHTIFMREHNRIARDLAFVNPHWSDEQLFQNSRKIMTATLQHMSYNEFLPRVLGWNAVKLYELDLLPEGYYNGYDSKCNPGALNEFGAAAFRFGHSLIRPQMHRMDQFYNVKEPAVQLRESFNNPDKLYQLHMIDEIMRGLMSTPMETLDQFVTREVTNHLFEHKNRKYSGLDLISLNLQRGRDHGIRPYNDYRVICNLKRAQSFDELAREIPEEVIERLKQVYADVNDIDLFTGGLSERPLEGGMIGPTFGCIIGLQFRFLRKCDRFWYETADPVVRFTEAQLREIRKMSLAKVLCENCDVAESVQRRVFDMPHPFLNPRIPCQDLPTIDLRAWREPGPAPGTTCNIAGSIIQIGQSHLPSPCVQCTCTTEGSNCNSLRITNCEQLIATQPRDAVVNDRVCRAQCGHLLGDAINNNNLGPNNIRQARLVSNAVTPPAAPPAQNILPPQNPIINNNLGQQQVPAALAGGPLPPFDGSDGRRAPRRPGGNDFRPFRNRLNPLAALFRG